MLIVCVCVDGVCIGVGSMFDSDGRRGVGVGDDDIGVSGDFQVIVGNAAGGVVVGISWGCIYGVIGIYWVVTVALYYQQHSASAIAVWYVCVYVCVVMVLVVMVLIVVVRTRVVLVRVYALWYSVVCMLLMVVALYVGVAIGIIAGCDRCAICMGTGGFA